jgi:hypothetical protein
LICLSRPDHIESRVNRRAPQIAFRIFQRIGLAPAAQQSQKDRLQRIFGIACVPRNPVGRAENKLVMRSKRSLEFIRNRDRRFL